MTKVASKQKRILDIVSMLEKGATRKEVLQHFSKKCKLSARTLDNEMKEAKLTVDERNKEKERLRVEQTEQSIKESVNEAIISESEIDAVLSMIVTGRIEIEEIVRGESILRSVSPMEVIAAADKLYKRKGSYAPQKKEINGNIHLQDEPIIFD